MIEQCSKNSHRRALSHSCRRGISLTKNISSHEQCSISRPKCITLTNQKCKHPEDRFIRLIVMSKGAPEYQTSKSASSSPDPISKKLNFNKEANGGTTIKYKQPQPTDSPPVK